MPAAPAVRSSRRRTFEPRMERIAADRTHGARALSLAMLATVERAARAWTSLPGPLQRRELARAARRVRRAQPGMGPFLATAGELERLARVRSIPGGPAGAARRWAARTRATLRDEPGRLAVVVARAFPPGARVVTLSHSASLSFALRRLPRRRRPGRVDVLESLPGGEGRQFANELARAGLPARLVRDRSAARAVAVADLVAVGADTVEAQGDVVHKVGTRELARLARRAGIPFVVVAGRSKWSGGRRAVRTLPGQFDRTPRTLISAYWTDHGVIRGAGRSRKRP